MNTAVMVSVDKRQVYTLRIPWVTNQAFKGVSIAELLDDVALHLMETLPKASAEEMAATQFCPHLELRRVKVTAELEGPDKKKPTWTGRVAVVTRRWPQDDFHIATIPALGTETFALSSLRHLPEAVAAFLAEVARRRGQHALEAAHCATTEYLEILELDAELPSILPSRPPRRRKPKKGKRKKGQDGTRGARTKEEEAARRRLVAPVTLREVGNNLSHKAIDGRIGRTYGRDPLVRQLVRQLERPGAAILLVGPSGVGKTAIVHAIVQELADLKQSLQERTDVWAVDGNRIIAGMSMVGAWELRCKRMVEELSLRQDILYVDDLPSLVYTGRSAHSDAHVADYLEPHIARGEIRVIGECTPERLEATREEAPGFFSRFQLVQVAELTERETLGVLVSARRELERREELIVEMPVLDTILGLTRRFMPQRPYPGKAVSLLRALVTDYTTVDRDEHGRRLLGRAHLVDFFARQTGLPRFVLWEQQARGFGEIHAYFKEQIIAQAAASRAAAEVVTLLQQGLNDPDKPLATMMFVGPTGVGKTETAKALATYLFGSKDRLIRFDMSEFRDPWSASRLFGDRMRPEGELTRHVEQTPFAVVLFDEIEKADPSIFDALLQVFGEGRLTNAAGRTTDFCNTVLVMTSNLGVRAAQQSMGFGDAEGESRDQHYRKAAEAFFRPEFFNRIDRIVPFRQLGREAMAPLVRRILLEVLGRRGLRRAGVVVDVEPELVELLLDQGFDPRYGARSMRRTLEQRLTVPLARHLVAQPIHRTTIVQLFRHGREIGMELWALDTVERDPSAPAGLADWPALRARFEALRAQVDGLSTSPPLRALVDERSALLAALNAEALQAEGWVRLHASTHLIEELDELRRELDAFHDEFLDAWHFVEEVELLGMDGIIRNYDATHTRPQVVGTQLPIPLDRDVAFARAGDTFVELEHRFAFAAHQAEGLAGSEQQVLVRVLPVTQDDGSRSWCEQMATALAGVWSRAGHVRRWFKRAGRWSDEERDREHEPLEAMAIDARGYGILPIVEDEVGFHVDAHLRGADLALGIVRIEPLEGTGEPGARLRAADTAWELYCEARRRGEPVESPLGPLAIRRRFEEHVAIDPRTGLQVGAALTFGSTRLSDLFSDSFRTELERVAMRRLLQRAVARRVEEGEG